MISQTGVRMTDQLSRRQCFLGAATALVASNFPVPADARWTQNKPAQQDSTRPRTPQEALAKLKEGNKAFLADKAREITRSAAKLAESQSPYCAILSCSDSRVPPELLFGGGLGDIFVVRNAGNVLSTAALGSLEYAVWQLNVPLIVVLGHQNCGAVSGALSVARSGDDFPGVIGNMLEPILPAAIAHRSSNNALESATKFHVTRMVGALRTRTDPLLQEPQRGGRLLVTGAYYEIADKPVQFWD